MAYVAEYKSVGDTIPYTPSGSAVAAGAVIVVGDVVAVAKNDIADGAEGVLYVTGKYWVKKNESEAFTQGAIIYYDVADANATTDADSGTNKKMGYATVAAGAADTHGMVLIDR